MKVDCIFLSYCKSAEMISTPLSPFLAVISLNRHNPPVEIYRRGGKWRDFVVWSGLYGFLTAPLVVFYSVLCDRPAVSSPVDFSGNYALSITENGLNIVDLLFLVALWKMTAPFWLIVGILSSTVSPELFYRQFSGQTFVSIFSTTNHLSPSKKESL